MALGRFEPSNRKYFPANQPTRVGFDPSGPWQMVPYKGTRYLHLAVAGVSSFTVESDNPFIATVAPEDQYGGVDQNVNNVFKVDGLHQGRTFLTARGPNREGLAKIEIEVKHRLKRFIQFFLVSDKAGHRTTVTETDTKEAVAFMNTVFEDQINVHFEYLRTRPITIDEDLGASVNFQAIGDMPFVRREGEAGRIWHKITDFGMLEPAAFNVFCLWSFESQSNEGDPLAGFVASKVRVTADEMEKSGANYNMCMLSDHDGLSAFPHHLAHEAGHYLNRHPRHTDLEGHLMRPGGLGSLLLKADARRMNPSPG